MSTTTAYSVCPYQGCGDSGGSGNGGGRDEDDIVKGAQTRAASDHPQSVHLSLGKGMMIGLDWKLLLSLTDARGEHCCDVLTMC